MSEMMAGLPPSVADDAVRAFTEEVRAALGQGNRHATPGFGTFSTCTRKAAPGRAACTMAMFRANKQLREHVSAGAASEVSGPHTSVVTAIVEAMQREQGVDVPGLGHLAAVQAAGKKPRLIFHADQELNDALTAIADAT
jgi:nucleoid DNA-binding protein